MLSNSQRQEMTIKSKEPFTGNNKIKPMLVIVVGSGVIEKKLKMIERLIPYEQ